MTTTQQMEIQVSHLLKYERVSTLAALYDLPEEIYMIKADLSEPLLFNHDMSINVSYGHYYDTFPTHWHNFMEIIAPLTGDYYVTIGTEEKKLNENHIAIIPPRTLHAIRTSNEEPNLIIQFSCGLLLNRMSHQVSARVTNDFDTFFVFRRNNLKAGIRGNQVRCID